MRRISDVFLTEGKGRVEAQIGDTLILSFPESPSPFYLMVKEKFEGGEYHAELKPVSLSFVRDLLVDTLAGEAGEYPLLFRWNDDWGEFVEGEKVLARFSLPFLSRLPFCLHCFSPIEGHIVHDEYQLPYCVNCAITLQI